MYKYLNLLSFFLFFSQTSSLSSSYNIDYKLQNNKVFSYSNNDSFILDSFNKSINICEEYCTLDKKCSGYYINNETNISCNTLSSLGELENINNNYEYSYLKTINYNHNHSQINNSSSIIVYLLTLTNNTLITNKLNTLLYIDRNHDKEPNFEDDILNFTQNDFSKTFYNLTHGIYEIRQKIYTPNCFKVSQGYKDLI